MLNSILFYALPRPDMGAALASLPVGHAYWGGAVRHS